MVELAGRSVPDMEPLLGDNSSEMAPRTALRDAMLDRRDGQFECVLKVDTTPRAA